MSEPGERWRRLAWSEKGKFLFVNPYKYTTKGKKIVDPNLFTIMCKTTITTDPTIVDVLKIPKTITGTFPTPQDERYQIEHPYYPAIKYWVVKHCVDNPGTVTKKSDYPEEMPIYSLDGTVNNKSFSLESSVRMTFEDRREDNGSLVRRYVSTKYATIRYSFVRDSISNDWKMTEVTNFNNGSISERATMIKKEIPGEKIEVNANDEDFTPGIDIPIF